MACSGLPWAAHLISALADGITPSVFLSAQDSKGPEYCFSVPEAFSRLGLEHKGGLGSLLLRLSQDGHAQLEVVGPPGTAQFVHSLRHMYFWRHPKVFVTELGRSDSDAVYSDQHLTVFPLLAGGEALPCPDCLPLPPSKTATSPPPVSSPRTDSKTEDSTTSSSEEDESEDGDPPATDQETAMGAVPGTPDSYDSSGKTAVESKTSLLFDDFDTLFTTKTEASRLKKTFLRKVNDAPTFRRCQLSMAGNINGGNQSETVKMDQKSHPEPVLPPHLAQPLPSPSPHPLPSAPTNPPLCTPQTHLHQSMNSSNVDTSECCAYKQRGGADCSPFSTPPPDSLLPQLPPGVNPIYLRVGSSLAPLASAVFPGGRGGEPPVLGYFCYLKLERKAFLILDCPTANQIRELKRITATWHSQDSCHPPLPPSLGAVFHITSPSFMQAPLYSSLIQSFHPNLLQVGLGVGPPELGFLSSLRLSQTLHTVSPLHFPLPSTAPSHPPLPPLPTHLSAGRLLMKVVFGDKGTQNWRLESILPPAPPLSDSSLPGLSRSEVEATLLKERGEEDTTASLAAAAVGTKAVSKFSANKNMAKALRSILKDSTPRSLPSPFELLFLGTGSAEPSKYRASTGILLTLHPSPGMDTFMLMDAGVGTLGQLKRCLGLEEAGRVVGRLGCVWVSHRHADHAGGVMAVLGARGEGAEPLPIVGPAALEESLGESACAMRVAGERVAPYRFLRCSQLSGRGTSRSRPGFSFQEYIVDKLQLVSLQSVPVDHCRDAWAIIIKGHPNWSLAFSGDTRPCPSLIQAAQNCTLLIHEATYEDREELRHLALRNRHSTVGEAVGVGEACGAHRVLLTHFSQRHPKAVAVNPEKCSRACITFDGMRVTHAQLEGLPYLMPRLMAALEAEEDKGEKKGGGGGTPEVGVAGEEGPGGDAGVLSGDGWVEEVRGKGLRLGACCGEEESDDEESGEKGGEREEKGVKRICEGLDGGNSRKHVRFLDSDSSGEESG